MADIDGVYESLTENIGSDVPHNLPVCPSGISDNSTKNITGGYLPQNEDESEDDAPKKRAKKRIQNFSDSDSDNDTQNQTSESGCKEILKPKSDSGDSDSNMAIFKSIPRKSRIQNNESSDSDSSKSEQAVKNQEQQARMKNKRDKLKNKFQDLKSSRGKEQLRKPKSDSNNSTNDSSDDSNDGGSSIEKIKQKIKERMSFIPSICDPHTSDEENSLQKSVPKQKKERRTIKLTSPKPQRMTAKQAMENMQKIKSESNRMLREKEVSLPYHRPKALSLKDIMSRRQPAVSADGKSLPIKMNGEQLRQYAQQLEERQKQMMELWKSDSDDDDENDNKHSDGEKDSCRKNIDEVSVQADKESVYDIGALMQPEISPNENDNDADKTAEDNDQLFDDLNQSVTEESKINDISKDDTSNEVQEVELVNKEGVCDKQDSETSIKLVFNDSDNSQKSDSLNTIEVQTDNSVKTNDEINKPQKYIDSAKTNTEDSQLISLHFDTEKFEGTEIEQSEMLAKESTEPEPEIVSNKESIDKSGEEDKAMEVDDFSDDDMNIDDIDNIIENAEIIRDIEDKISSQVLIRDINVKPKLTGAPGMVIDLDAINNAPKKTGVELLKERFTYFAKLKTPEELERQREKKIKPGTQHSKLKQVLEEQMAEQRSIEWSKRLDEEKQHQKELKELRGEESDDENDIDKIEAKLEGDGDIDKSESDSEEELEENDIEMEDKPRVKNPLLENEAEESDCDENEDINSAEHNDEIEDGKNENGNNDENDEEIDNEDDESSDDSSSESEGEQVKTRKGRILKAFEDSDDEETGTKTEQKIRDFSERKSSGSVDLIGSKPMSQDEVLTLAQRHKSVSEDLFTTQGSSPLVSQKPQPESIIDNDVDLGTQTFSILESTKNATTEEIQSSDNMVGICETQPFDDNLDAVAAMCSGSFTQSGPLALPITQISQSQPIGEELLALCTGKFYNNEFVSQVADEKQLPLGASQEFDSLDDDSQIDNEIQTDKETNIHETSKNSVCEEIGATQVILGKINVKSSAKEENVNSNKENNIHVVEEAKKPVDNNLKSILDELDDPEFDKPKPNKFFCGAKTQKRSEVAKEIEVESQIKKRFIIDSDDETNDGNASELKKRKKLKKKKPEKRALQISDDEDEASEQEDIEYESEIEEENTERLVEYDSEENEIEVKQKPLSKKKRKGTEFFEQEAELTSEDEWVGSGDENEAGLDTMEREEGDDESFHQGRLQRELGQIHMRDVLDQDKREVRIIQELLFEDGDLGGGGRQRKFKWKNLDGEDETGGTVNEFGDTQEEEFESEEQWRKQRHERETFLRQMQNNGELDDSLNVSINRTTIIKANLSSKSVSMLLEESAAVDKTDPVVPEKKIRVPSPKKPFSLLQQSYQGSILNRGRGALARLAALATPLAVDDDAPKVGSVASSSRRNFVFATLTPEAPKVTKRKAEANPSTPKLVKKMKTEEKHNIFKSSLLDHMKV